MRSTRQRIMPFILLGLGACAGPQGIDLSSAGAVPPDRPALYASGETGAGSPETKALLAVQRALAAHGWAASEGGGNWRIEVAYVERPGRVGGFAEEAPPAETGSWRAPPMRPRWWRRDHARRSLALRIMDDATGHEVARSVATQRDTGEPLPVVLERLASAAVAQVLDPPAE